MNQDIYLKNNIGSKYFNTKIYEKDKIKINKIINNIFISLDSEKDTFHSLSTKLNLDFKYSDLTKFNKYKSVVLIGIGGSALSAKAILYQNLEILLKL